LIKKAVTILQCLAKHGNLSPVQFFLAFAPCGSTIAKNHCSVLAHGTSMQTNRSRARTVLTVKTLRKRITWGQCYDFKNLFAKKMDKNGDALVAWRSGYRIRLRNCKLGFDSR
jgi:hypothetical protein